MINKIKTIKQLLYKVDAILITAGAGMGVDSGLPDFRGTQGFWKAYPPIAKLGLDFQDMANPIWFEKNPSLAWAFYGHRLNLYRDTIPHIGFKILLDLVKSKNDNYFIYTSNVDGQFQKAGFDDNKIYEVHGSIHHLQCTNNCSDKIWSANNEYINIDMEKFKALNIPLCPNCKKIARPNILMFGDYHWNETRAIIQENKYNEWLKTNKNKKTVIIEIGAGLDIPTIQHEDDYLSKNNQNITLIRINPRDYQVYNPNDISLPCGGLDGIKYIQ